MGVFKPLNWYGGWTYNDYDDPIPPLEVQPQPQAQPWPRPSKNLIGLVMGRFDPLHLGHLGLLNFAQNLCQKLYVAVRPGDSEYSETFPLQNRVAWLQATLAPEVEVEVFPLSWPLNVAEFKSRFEDVQALFTNETDQVEFARQLGIPAICPDPQRVGYPVSGSAIRLNLFSYWNALTPAVRGSLVRRVAVLGPENAGKTRLCRFLGEQLYTTVVPEVAQGFAQPLSGKLTSKDYSDIAHYQLALTESLAPVANKILICDTSLDQLYCWQHRLLGKADRKIYQPCKGHDLNLILQAESDFGQKIRHHLRSRGLSYLEMPYDEQVALAKVRQVQEAVPVNQLVIR